MYFRKAATAACLQLGMGYGETSTVDIENMTDVRYTWSNPVTKEDKRLVWLDYVNVDDSVDDSADRIDSFMDPRVEKGFWGRPLTDFGRCNTTKTIKLHCIPLLVCYYCKSDNLTGCYQTAAMTKKTCDENVIQCYMLKTKNTDGKVSILHDCGYSVPRGSKSTKNHNTCELERKNNQCGVNGKVCYCKNCYGRVCNSSPLYESTKDQTATVTGTLDFVMMFIDNISKLIRVGMFDLSVANNNTSDTTIHDNTAAGHG